MRFPSVVLVSIATLLALGCAGDAAPPAQETPPVAAAVEPATPLAEGEEDLFKQYGPDTQPDRDADPVQFWYWRVDEMFRTRDLNTDGKIERDEFTGIGTEFKAIDRDEDGLLTKKEVIDHVTITYIEVLESPSE